MNTDLEMLYVNDVKTDNCSEQSHIRFGNILSIIIRSLTLTQMFLNPIQGCEELDHSLLVCFLLSGKARSVDSIVNIIVCPFICSFDFLLEIGRKEINILVFRSNDVIELS